MWITLGTLSVIILGTLAEIVDARRKIDRKME